MGHSAKLHKRIKKPAAPQPKPAAASVPAVQSAKKRAGLKSRAKARSGTKGGQGGVLGGADYVTLLWGGRRKAAEEATRMT